MADLAVEPTSGAVPAGAAPSRNARRVLLVLLGLAAAGVLAAPLLGLPDPGAQDLLARLAPPAWQDGGSLSHLLGTDHLGRDMLARMVFGARLTLFIAVAGVVCSGIVGTVLGILAGYLRSWVDAVVSRLVEAQLALPFMLLAIAIIASRGQSLGMLVFVLATYGWAEYARVLRAEVLSLRERSFVLGLRAAGASRSRIMRRHILPNVASTLLVVATLQVGFMVLGESALSFLGLGVVAPQVSWGLMLAEGRSYFTDAWWVVGLPGIAIAGFVLLVNLTGDVLRRRYDPRRRRWS